MTSPFDISYLTTASPLFGPLAWVFFALQIAGMLVGIYLAFVRRDPANALRRSLLQRFGYALLVVGGLGVLVGVLRLADVGIFTQRFWFYLVLLVEVVLAGYVAYYARFRYRKQLSQTHTSRGKAPGTARAAAPRQWAPAGRRRAPSRCTGWPPRGAASAQTQEPLAGGAKAGVNCHGA
jgi:hypothetical protein